jgi:hypothetical protein
VLGRLARPGRGIAALLGDAVRNGCVTPAGDAGA